MNSLKYFGLAIVSAGIVNPPDAGYEVLTARNALSYRKVVLLNGRIVGFLFINDIQKSGIMYNLLRRKVDVSGFREELLADGFGLISLPEELWRPYLEASAEHRRQAVNAPEQAADVLAGE
ncbi:MAG: hypothetical protein N2506_06095 [Dehalococcoidales bacterium]|nr:hypothetical protein [Dehalococcoidales bacterium]